MIIIHAMNDRPLPRLLGSVLADHLRVMPAVFVTGPRQAGKSTLVQQFPPAPRLYRTLDDMDTLAASEHDPSALLGGVAPITLDEVQRAPQLLPAIKKAIDQDRIPGQYLLTGSANLLMMRQATESLAGRASYLTLWPMTRREQLGQARAGFWEELLSAPEEDWEKTIDARSKPTDWREWARRGGFPTPAIDLPDAQSRAIWFEGFVRTYLERDLRDLASISSLPDFNRLMRITSHRLGQLVNQTELGRAVGLSQATVHRWLNLLETSYMLVRLPAFSLNRSKRLIKAPKLYWADTGVALHLAGAPDPSGAHLENLVLMDLLAWSGARSSRAELFYWRTVTGDEIDFVVEVDGRLLPVEVKSTSRPRLADAAGLRSFRKEYADLATAGLLLHTGAATQWLTPDVLAVPWWRVL